VKLTIQISGLQSMSWSNAMPFLVFDYLDSPCTCVKQTRNLSIARQGSHTISWSACRKKRAAHRKKQMQNTLSQNLN
jgi:hypothetical protein